jgi:hypothetical protein
MGRKWTEKERKYVKENWGKIPTQVMSLKIDRTESAIKNMARSITKSKVEDKRKSYEEQRRNAAKKATTVQDMYLQSLSGKRL